MKIMKLLLLINLTVSHVVEDRHKLQEVHLRSILDGIYGKIYIVHRLDAGTGGIIVCAKNSKVHSIFCSMFENKNVNKTYLAVVKGSFDKELSLMLPISTKVSRGRYKINFKSGRTALTTFLKSSCSKNASLVRVIPITGRTHQIRVHLKALKFPLYVDRLYNEGDGRQKTYFVC